MKHLFVLLVALMMAISSQARQLTSAESLSQALTSLRVSAPNRAARVDEGAYRLVHTQRAASDAALYYVYETPAGGFMLTAGDTRANAVLGYTDNGSYAEAQSNPAFMAWLSQCREVLTALSGQPEQEPQGQRLMPLRTEGRPEAVAPLLKTIWDQNAPFNDLCPIIPSGNYAGDHSATGCVATGMTQVMKFYEWPKQGRGSNAYTSKPYDFELSRDFSESTYDWANMLNSYKEGYTAEQGAAVARLMSDAGISVNMEYDHESGAVTFMCLPSLAEHFGYRADARILQRAYCSTDDWNELLHDELAQSRPLLFKGTNPVNDAGHCFVIDGYDNMGLYHVNWGWGGSSNGYFDINFLASNYQGIGGSGDAGGGYNGDQAAFLGLMPDYDGTSEPAYDIVCTQLSFDKNAKQLSILTANFGLKPYKNQLGFLIKVDGEPDRFEGMEFPEEYSMTFGLTLSLSMAVADLVDLQKYPDVYVPIYPAYLDDNNEVCIIPCHTGEPQCFILKGTCLEDVDNFHYTREVSKLSLESIRQVGKAYAGHSARLTIQMSNDLAGGEFGNVISLYAVVNGENKKLYSNIRFLQPGEEATLQAKINLKDFAPGDYDISVIYDSNNTHYYLAKDAFTLTVLPQPEPASLKYSNLAFFDASVAQGDSIECSFQVTNTGGYTERNYRVFYFHEGETTSFDYTHTVSAYIETNETTPVVFLARMDLAPGRYFCAVRDLIGNEWISNRHFFTVTEPIITTLPSLPATEAVEAPIYNLQGQRVSTMQPGRVYMQGGQRIVAQ